MLRWRDRITVDSEQNAQAKWPKGIYQTKIENMYLTRSHISMSVRLITADITRYGKPLCYGRR